MPPTTPTRSLRAVQVVVYALWPSTIWAAQITLGESLASVPVLAWLMVGILSTVSSLAALLNRLKTDTPPRLPVFVASHIVGSLLAGCLSFFVVEAFDLHDMVEAVAIALAAYSGAKLMDRWADAFTNRISAETERGSSAPKATTPPQQ